MSEHANKREKRLAMLVVAAVVLFTVLLIVETFRLLLPGLWSAFSAGDEQALSEYLASQGRLRSFLTLWFLAVVQVLSLVIPAMPVQLAAGLAYGPWMGFLTSFSASAVANMSVYLIARRLVPVIRRLVADTPKAAKLLDSVRSSKDPWFYTILAFITPGLPNGIIPYAAANAGMRPKQFLAAIFISLPFPTLLTCAVAAVMFEKFRESDFMKKVMYGIRPACLGLIIAVVCSLTATNYTNAAGSISYGAALIGVAATVLLLKFKVSIPKVILLSAVLGLFLTR